MTATDKDKNRTDKSATNISNDKKVKISETISKHHDLAPPVKNVDISITVGQRVPSRIYLHPIPTTIVTIAPEYRDYQYFTTEEDVVIVSPRTHEIVTRIPRDASRARAESEGGSSTTVTSTSSDSGSAPCQIFRRTASGDLNRLDPSQVRETTGSAIRTALPFACRRRTVTKCRKWRCPRRRAALSPRPTAAAAASSSSRAAPTAKLLA